MKNETVKRVIKELKTNKVIENEYYKLMDLRNICWQLNQDRLELKIDKKYFNRLYKIIKNQLDIEENKMENLYIEHNKKFRNALETSLFFGVSVAAVRKWNLDKSNIPYYVWALIKKEDENLKLKEEINKLNNLILGYLK